MLVVGKGVSISYPESFHVFFPSIRVLAGQPEPHNAAEAGLRMAHPAMVIIVFRCFYYVI